MMILSIHHKTHYQYTEPVFLNPHHLYFRPLDREHVRVISHQLKIDPQPDGLAMRIDPEGNRYHQAWWNNMTPSLDITAQMEVEISEFNPYAYFVETDAAPHAVLDVYLEPSETITPGMTQWAAQILGENGDRQQFIIELVKTIHEQWTYETRHEIGLMSLVNCFEQRTGSCRDLSWLTIHALRSCHIPARFVSGYSYNADLGQEHELHAWVEAWLPGAGWIGIDPSLGLLADHSYVAIATSYDPKKTHPVQGIYAGSATAEMTYEVKIEERN